jgi:hypothetical protein
MLPDLNNDQLIALYQQCRHVLRARPHIDPMLSHIDTSDDDSLLEELPLSPFNRLGLRFGPSSSSSLSVSSMTGTQYDQAATYFMKMPLFV